ADDILHVPAGAEVALVRAEHHRLHVIGGGERAECVAQFGVGFEGDRVLALGPRQLDERDLAVEPPVEMLRLEVFHAHARAPPLRMRAGSPSRWAMIVSASSAPKSASSRSTQS